MIFRYFYGEVCPQWMSCVYCDIRYLIGFYKLRMPYALFLICKNVPCQCYVWHKFPVLLIVMLQFCSHQNCKYSMCLAVTSCWVVNKRTFITFYSKLLLDDWRNVQHENYKVAALLEALGCVCRKPHDLICCVLSS